MNHILSKKSLNYSILIFIFVFSLAYPANKLFLLPNFWTWFCSALLVGMILYLGIAKNAIRPNNIRILYSLIPAALFFIYSGFYGIFGDFDFTSIIFHLEMGAGGGLPQGLIKSIFKFSLSYVLFVSAFFMLINLDRRFLLADRAIFIPLLLVNPLLWSAGDYLFINRYDDTLLKAYSAPDNIIPPRAAAKNLIIIYAESAERTFADISHGEVVFSEMMQLASSGIHVRGIRQAANTGWSMAGFVSSQCGVPLQPRGLIGGNMFDGQTMFFPGIRCLSDVLGDYGYHTEFINGSDHQFAGMTAFLTQHQFSRVAGLNDYRQEAGEYLNSWGLYDDTLFEQAAIRLHDLHQQTAPFMMSVATIGGHFPDGHPTKTCNEKLVNKQLAPILFAMKCTGYEIDRFIESLRKSGLLRNTIVAIVSDHLVMKNQYTPELESKDRMNYFTVIGDDIRPADIAKEAAMFDLFPTFLELLDFKPEQSRAGLGVSLLSKQKTMVEIYGLAETNRAIKNDRLLSRRIWTEPKLSAITAKQ